MRCRIHLSRQITAGNASQLSDGASACVVMSEEAAAKARHTRYVPLRTVTYRCSCILRRHAGGGGGQDGACSATYCYTRLHTVTQLLHPVTPL